MKVDPKTVVFVLELVGSLALAAGGVVARHYLPSPGSIDIALER